MAGPHTTAVLLASKSRDTDRMTFVAVTSFMARETHKAWPPVRYIAHAIGRSVRQTQKCLRRLEASLELVVERRDGATNVYKLAPHLADLANRIAAGERGLWKKFSTGGDDALRSETGSRGVDEGHPRDEDAVRRGGDDTRHPNLNSTIQEQTPSAMAADIALKVKVLKTELARGGVKTTPQDKARLEELVRLGAGANAVLQAVATCAATAGVNNPFAYGAQTLINQLLEGRGAVGAPARAWEDVPWQVVVSMGRELGVGTWDPDRSKEHFPSYKKRVTDAMRQAENETGTSVSHKGIPPQ